MYYENIDSAVIDAESLPWIPFLPYADNVFLKLLKVDAVRGEWITLLKVPQDMQLPKHHHSGTVMVYTISGTWRYLEHDWTAGPAASSSRRPERSTHPSAATRAKSSR